MPFIYPQPLIVVLRNILYETVYLTRYGSVAPTEERYQEHKKHYRRQRDTFRSDPRALPELEAWRKRDTTMSYQLLNFSGKAFVPSALVGRDCPPHQPFGKADTFFSEYALHNDESLILSESNHSYIIGNLASYDARQYPLAPTEKRPEGQGYCHTLVIPKARIYNVVDPAATDEHCFILQELRIHFLQFWATDYGKQAILSRAKKALDDRDRTLLNPPPGDGRGQRPPEYTMAVRGAVFADFERLQREFIRLKGEEDFLFGFHVFPDNSIGHLHMHVFPHDNSFRVHSTKDYDYKTIPLQAILDVEEEDSKVATPNGVANGSS
ncbi:MAG: hypothetical protein Q9213_004613 [Squamulea squamosa]